MHGKVSLTEQLFFLFLRKSLAARYAFYYVIAFADTPQGLVSPLIT